MIDKISMAQYMNVEKKAKADKAARKDVPSRSKVESSSEGIQDKAVISNRAKKAQEIAKFTKMAKAMPAVDADKIKEFKLKTKSPRYLKNLAKDFSEKIADKIVEAIDARYEPED